VLKNWRLPPQLAGTSSIDHDVTSGFSDVRQNACIAQAFQPQARFYVWSFIGTGFFSRLLLSDRLLVMQFRAVPSVNILPRPEPVALCTDWVLTSNRHRL
jgi:capsid portal protein